MKKFEAPEAEILLFGVQDIITTSNEVDEGTCGPDELPIH